MSDKERKLASEHNYATGSQWDDQKYDPKTGEVMASESKGAPAPLQRNLLNTLKDVACGHYSPEEGTQLILSDFAAHCQAPAPAQLVEALKAARIRYSRDHGMPNPTEPFPVEIVFSLNDWQLVQNILLAAATPQGTPQSDPVRLLLIRALTEMSYMHCAEVLSSVRSAEGEAIIEEGMKLIGLKDLSEEELARVRNGEVGNGKR